MNKRVSNYKEVQKSPELAAKFYNERKVHHDTGAKAGKEARSPTSGQTRSPRSSVRSKSRRNFSPTSGKESAKSVGSGKSRHRMSSVKFKDSSQKVALKQKV